MAKVNQPEIMRNLLFERMRHICLNDKTIPATEALCRLAAAYNSSIEAECHQEEQARLKKKKRDDAAQHEDSTKEKP